MDYLFTFLIILFGTLLSGTLLGLLFEKKIILSQQRQTQTHMLNSAIQDLLLNLWFTQELIENQEIESQGTYARYWFDSIHQLNLSLFSNHSKNYTKMTALVHMMDVDNKKMEHGYFTDPINQAKIIQSHLSSWVDTFNALIQSHQLKIPPLPSSTTLLAEIKKEYNSQQ